MVGVLWSEQSVEPLAARKLDCGVIFLLSPKFSPTFSPITIPPLIGLSVRGFGKKQIALVPQNGVTQELPGYVMQTTETVIL